MNLDGKVVGINTAMFALAQGVGFAIAIEKARPVIDNITAGRKVAYPWLGTVMATVTPALAAQYDLARSVGTVVVHVENDSPAYWTGIRSGDIVASLDGHALNRVGDMGEQMARHSAGDTIKLQVIRNGQEIYLSALLKELPLH